MKKISCSLGLTAILLLSSGALFGASPVITKAVPDLDAGTLSISGNNFGPSAQVFIGTDLGTLVDEGVLSLSETFIEVTLTATNPGTYLLVVTNGNGKSKMVAMDLTISAEVPEPNLNIITEDTPTFNTAIGVDALVNNNTGTSNTASGGKALFNNSTGTQNTATGILALANNTTGNNNTADGAGALAFNTSGQLNTASGAFALGSNTTGLRSTAIGHRALQNSNNNDNTAVGSDALQLNTTGARNTATGHNALFGNTTGHDNIGIGNDAGFNATTGDHNIYIGNPGVAAESNTIRIGDGSIHTSAFIAGIQFVFPSSKRFKEDIRDMSEASTNLMHLRPITFRYKKEYDTGGRRLQFGLIAEEVADFYPELVVNDDTGKPRTVLYQELNVLLLNEVQKQHRHILELTERLTRLEQDLTSTNRFAQLAK